MGMEGGGVAGGVMGEGIARVMAAYVISISSDSSEESVGSHVPRVILFGTIPTRIPVIPVVPVEVPIAPTNLLVAPEVGAVYVISPTEVLDLVDYSSSSDSDPSEDSLSLAPELPLFSPFFCSDDSEADSSLSYSSSVHSLGCDASGQSHSGPSTRVASPRSAPLSTLYPPTTLETSLDSSSERSLDSSSPAARPSRKRCRSPTTLVPSYTPVPRSIAPALDDLPPRKRFRDSYSSEDSREEHMEFGTADAEAVADLGISDGVGAHTEDGIGMGVEVATSNIREDKEEFEAWVGAGGTMEITVDPLVTGGISEPTGGDVPDLKRTLYDIAHYMLEVPLDRITEFETAQRQLEVGQLVASGERAGLADRIKSLGRENLRVRALLCIERDRVDSLRRHMALSQEEFCQICRDRDDTQGRLR
ncbi:hypothetical protein Tco_1329930, partial [Tanacetum coccineum]